MALHLLQAEGVSWEHFHPIDRLCDYSAPTEKAITQLLDWIIVTLVNMNGVDTQQRRVPLAHCEASHEVSRTFLESRLSRECGKRIGEL